MISEDVTYRFGGFVLDVANRRLTRDGAPIELNARYFDALTLLVREHGRLVSKERFFDEVWGDVVVSDSALTQCIKDIRRQLGDEAGNPRFIETVPRYGYRFVGQVQADPALSAVEVIEPTASVERPSTRSEPSASSPGVPARTLLWAGAGALGGAIAGVFGGLLYGSALAQGPAGAGLGTASVLLVMLSLNIVVGFAGGIGVSCGMAAARLIQRREPEWSIAGAAIGGLLVGGVARLLGVDAFNLLFGQAPAGITGGIEGLVLGAAIAAGARVGGRLSRPDAWRSIVGAGVGGALAGALIPAAGGNLMGGSLDLLARSFDGSQLRLDTVGRLFGDVQFGETTQIALGGVEGMLFGVCVVGAMSIAYRVMTGREGMG